MISWTLRELVVLKSQNSPINTNPFCISWKMDSITGRNGSLLLIVQVYVYMGSFLLHIMSQIHPWGSTTEASRFMVINDATPGMNLAFISNFVLT